MTGSASREMVMWRRALRQLAWLVGLIIAGWFVIRYLFVPLFPLLLGMAWAGAARPLARRFPRFIPSAISSLTSVTVIIASSVAAAALVSWRVAHELIQMSVDSVAWQKLLLESWGSLQDQWLMAKAEMPEPLVFAIDTAIADGVLQVGALLNTVPSVAFQMTRQIPFVLIALVVAAVVAALLALGEPITLRFNRYFPPAWRQRIEDLELAVVAGVGHYLKVQIMIMLGTFTLTLVALTFLGVRNAFLISLLIAILDLIPVVGPGIVVVPWVTVSWLLGRTTIVWVLVGLYLTILVGRRYAEPRLLAHAWGEGGPSPVGMLAALWLGFYFGGLPGAIGTPLALLVSYSLTRPRHHHGEEADDLEPPASHSE